MTIEALSERFDVISCTDAFKFLVGLMPEGMSFLSWVQEAKQFYLLVRTM